MNALFCFDNSTNMAVPWAEAGVQCVCVDIVNESGIVTYPGGGTVESVHANMLTWVPDNDFLEDCVFMCFFPPCTDVAISGARWMKDKGLGALIRSLELFKACLDIAQRSFVTCPYCIENPVGVVGTYWRKPDHIFHPYEYAGYGEVQEDRYTKKTCLWVGNGFVMPEKKPLSPVYGSKMRNMARTVDRAKLRSITPVSFARAVFEANYPSRE